MTRVERETADELRAHLAQTVDALVARGMPRRAAEEEAERRFGPSDARDEVFAAARHRERVLTMFDRLDALRHDITSAVRQIRRVPGLAIAVTATFALGVGANATMFGIVDRLLLRAPVGIPAPESVVRVDYGRWRNGVVSPAGAFSYPAYTTIRDNTRAFASVAMQTFPSAASLGLGAAARSVQYILVSGTYFPTLGTRMVAGRPILPGDDVLPAGSPVVVIGYGLWQGEFAGDPAAIGKSITLAGRQYRIIGVAPRDFVGPGTRPLDAWIPVSAGEGLRFPGADWETNRNTTWMSVFGRLSPGVTPRAAGDQVASAIRAWSEASTGKPDTTTRAVPQPSILPRRQASVTPERRVALLLAAVSLLVLLIACANVANLLLSRALRRRREIAVRLALGISRARLIRQFLLEGTLLAAMGGVGALAIVGIGSVAVYRVLLTSSAVPTSFVDGRVLGYILTITVAVGLLAALVPALQASRPRLISDLKEGTRGAGVSHSRTRVALLLVQASLSVVLLSGTGLFIMSLRNVTRVGLGVDVDHLVVGTIDLRSVGIDSAAAGEYFRELLPRVRAIPGVESAVVAEASPFTGWSVGGGFRIPGRDSVPHFENGPNLHWVNDGYFQAVGTRIVRGRAIAASDVVPGAARVTVINESAARILWPSGDAVGQCVLRDDKTTECTRIVGVAEDTHFSAVMETGTRAQLYLPVANDGLGARTAALIVRPRGDPESIVAAVRQVMQTVRAGLPYASVQPMQRNLESELRPWRLGATLFGVFGGIALVLAALGLYSVVAYTVAQRMHEMGVRVALGARAVHVIRLVLVQGVGVAAAGVLVGLGLVIAFGRLVGPLLYQVSPRDPAVFLGVSGVLLLVAIAASLVPARRAMRVDPIVALRAE